MRDTCNRGHRFRVGYFQGDPTSNSCILRLRTREPIRRERFRGRRKPSRVAPDTAGCEGRHAAVPTAFDWLHRPSSIFEYVKKWFKTTVRSQTKHSVHGIILFYQIRLETAGHLCGGHRSVPDPWFGLILTMANAVRNPPYQSLECGQVPLGGSRLRQTHCSTCVHRGGQNGVPSWVSAPSYGLTQVRDGGRSADPEYALTVRLMWLDSMSSSITAKTLYPGPSAINARRLKHQGEHEQVPRQSEESNRYERVKILIARIPLSSRTDPTITVVASYS